MNELKDLVKNFPYIYALDYTSNNKVILGIDTLHITVGYILQQVGDDLKHYPSHFGSIILNECESQYFQAKLESFGLFRALKDVRIWIIGVRNLIIEVDMKYIKGMINNPNVQPSVAINCWISAILLFGLPLKHIPGKDHGPDSLSWHPWAPEDLEINDDYEE